MRYQQISLIIEEADAIYSVWKLYFSNESLVDAPDLDHALHTTGSNQSQLSIVINTCDLCFMFLLLV